MCTDDARTSAGDRLANRTRVLDRTSPRAVISFTFPLRMPSLPLSLSRARLCRLNHHGWREKPGRLARHRGRRSGFRRLAVRSDAPYVCVVMLHSLLYARCIESSRNDCEELFIFQIDLVRSTDRFQSRGDRPLVRRSVRAGRPSGGSFRRDYSTPRRPAAVNRESIFAASDDRTDSALSSTSRAFSTDAGGQQRRRFRRLLFSCCGRSAGRSLRPTIVIAVGRLFFFFFIVSIFISTRVIASSFIPSSTRTSWDAESRDSALDGRSNRPRRESREFESRIRLPRSRGRVVARCWRCSSIRSSSLNRFDRESTAGFIMGRLSHPE